MKDTFGTFHNYTVFINTSYISQAALDVLPLSDSAVINGLQTLPAPCSHCRIINNSVPFQDNPLLRNMPWDAPPWSKGQSWKPPRVGCPAAFGPGGSCRGKSALFTAPARLQGHCFGRSSKAERQTQVQGPSKGSV